MGMLVRLSFDQEDRHASYLLALQMELGPCQIREEGPLNGTASTYINPHSWNNNANLLFLDQPYVPLSPPNRQQLNASYANRVAVGFSYAEHKKHVSTTERYANLFLS